MKSSKLEPVKKLAEQKEQKAAQTFAQGQQSFTQAQAKLHELIQYKADYLAEFQFKAQKGIAGSQLQYYKSFMVQLDKAIQIQQEYIERLSAQVKHQKQEWQASTQKSQAMSQYQSRLKQDEIKKAEKLAEKRLEDDLNANRFRS